MMSETKNMLDLEPNDSECLVRDVSIVTHRKKRYYRYLGVDGRFHEVEEGKRVEVLPIGYGYTG